MTNPSSYKLICLNLWIGGILFDEIVDFLKKEDADILLLQEVFNSDEQSLEKQYRSLSELLKVLPYPYHHFAPTFLEEIEGKQIPQGNAILSKYPLKEVGITFFDYPFALRINEREHFHKSPRNVQHVTAIINDTPLHLLNTQGIWGEDGDDNPRRLRMAETILNEAGENRPAIVAGDFNLQPHTQTVKNIEKRFTNVFKDELATSFNVKRKDLQKYPGFASAVVDMVFTSDDVKVTSHSCPNVDVSDHLPLVIEFEV